MIDEPTQCDTGDADLEARSLGDHLAFARADEALPRMPRCPLETARPQLSSPHAGTFEPNLKMARFALGEWHRWLADACRRG